ncbi:MAG TPA: MFS transporter [Thermomicrobiales bacterium]|nr:MFS transporter [Thermomicrobiales bacterium]
MAVFRNRPLMLLMAGHFTIDMYGGMLPLLFPLLTAQFELDLATVGLVSLAYSGVSSLSQPAFGYIADKYGTRFTGLTMAWTALLFAAIGFAPNFPTLLVLAALAGFGSGAFHPLGALNASAVISDRQRNSAMSIYVTGGTVGFALGPLVGAAVFALFGMKGTAAMILPGVLIAIWLLSGMRTGATKGSRGRGADGQERAAPPLPLLVISLVILVMMLRMVPIVGLQTFIPVWYEDLGYDSFFYASLATTVVLSSAVGAIGAGSLADRFGRRNVIVFTLVASVPAVYLFAEFPGPWAFLWGALVGLLAASTAPLLLVMAQQLMVGRAGMASGLILGLSFIAGAVSAPVFGTIADSIGLQNAMRTLPLIVLLTIGVAWFLPTEKQMIQLTSNDTSEPSSPPSAQPKAPARQAS